MMSANLAHQLAQGESKERTDEWYIVISYSYRTSKDTRRLKDKAGTKHSFSTTGKLIGSIDEVI